VTSEQGELIRNDGIHRILRKPSFWAEMLTRGVRDDNRKL
jgi:hypothetical protein